MNPVTIVATVVYYLLLIYFLVMWVRLALDLSRTFARRWRPKGVVLVLSEVAYALTDPPVRLARRSMKPIKVGDMTLDFAWSIVMLAVVILIYITLVVRQV